MQFVKRLKCVDVIVNTCHCYVVICVLDINIYSFNLADMKNDTLNILKCVLSAEKYQYQRAIIVKHKENYNDPKH